MHLGRGRSSGVEHNLAKVRVARSNRVARSKVSRLSSVLLRRRLLSCVLRPNATSGARTLPCFASFDQAPHLGQYPLADRAPCVSRAEGDAEGDPCGDVAERGQEHLKIGGEPQTVLFSVTQGSERVAEGDGREDATNRDWDDGEVWDQPCEQIRARRPALEGLDPVPQHCGVWLHPSSGKIQNRATMP